MPCGPCISIVQFPGILSTDTNPAINGTAYSASTIDGLVSDCPQFWYQFGLTGVNTLHTAMIITNADLTVQVTRGTQTIKQNAVPAIVDHPVHAPH